MASSPRRGAGGDGRASSLSAQAELVSSICPARGRERGRPWRGVRLGAPPSGQGEPVHAECRRGTNPTEGGEGDRGKSAGDAGNVGIGQASSPLPGFLEVVMHTGKLTITRETSGIFFFF